MGVLPRQPSTQTNNSINNMSLISTIVLAVICAVAVSADHAMVHHAPHHAPHHPVTYGHGAGYYGYAPVHYKSPGQSYVHREMSSGYGNHFAYGQHNYLPATYGYGHAGYAHPSATYIHQHHRPSYPVYHHAPATDTTTKPTDTSAKPTKPALPLPLI